MTRASGALPLFPPTLRPGDAIAVIAPSGPFDPGPVRATLGWLEKRYRVRFDEGIFARQGYLAGSDERRREELERALGDGDVRAILAARGGYGASRFAHAIDWSVLARDPKWIVGFSDVTALHAEAARAGVASIHGPNVTGLGGASNPARADLLALLDDPRTPRRYLELEVIARGSAEGPLFGGNLTLLHALAAAGKLRVPEGAIVLLEDVTERPYRIDRMLTTLALGGHLAEASALCFGDFTQCDPGPDGVTVSEVLRDFVSRAGLPAVSGLPVGHGERNDAVVLGSTAKLAALGPRGSLTLAG